MDNAHSNPMSDYDFAEIPEEIKEEEIIPNAFQQRMEQNLFMVLAGYHLANEVLERIIQSGLKFNQLSSLSDEDLEMFGIDDREQREQMLYHFNTLEGQDEHFEAVMRQMKAERRKAESQETSVIDLIQNQLLSMNTLLAATIIKVGASKTSSSPGIVVNQNFNSPQVVLEMLQQLTEHGNQMADLIYKLKSRKEMDKRRTDLKMRNIKKNAFLGLLVSSGIVIGFLIAKKVRFG